MKKIKYFLLGIPSNPHLVAICIFVIQTMNCQAQLAWKDRQISIDAKSADKQVGAIFTGKNIGTKEIIIRDIMWLHKRRAQQQENPPRGNG